MIVKCKKCRNELEFKPIQGHDDCQHIIANVITSDLLGKIKCPHCSSKLGSYNMSGMMCSCEQFVGPFYGYIKSKVDLQQRIELSNKLV